MTIRTFTITAIIAKKVLVALAGKGRPAHSKIKQWGFPKIRGTFKGLYRGYIGGI